MCFQFIETDLKQPTSLANAYLNQYSRVAEYFHYTPYSTQSVQERIQYLQERTYQRDELAEVIRQYMQRWEITSQIDEHLRQLTEENSLVIIGGQQAGLMLGPLYTIHKAITILILAKQKKIELNRPVVPVFWIAGEDHDFLEINHIYLPRTDTSLMERLPLEEEPEKRSSVSYLPFPHQKVRAWLDEVFDRLPQTEFTDCLKQETLNCLECSSSYTDFFAALMHQLFAKHGLLMIDSADRGLRSLGSKALQTVIRQYEQIDRCVRQQIQRVEEQGFTAQVQVGEHPALLFIDESGERCLLEKRGTLFYTKDNRYTYTEEELLNVAQQEPWRLSNNVITRPMMQEILFPTLGFVGGPGEIAYWALYRSYFEKVGLMLPIIYPRVSMTLIEKPIAKIIEKREVPLNIIFSDLESFKRAWLEKQSEIHVEQLFTRVQQDITNVYRPLLQKIAHIPGIDQLGEKNLNKIMEQVTFLEKKALAGLRSQHDAALRQFDKLEQALYPHQKLQERLHNAFTFLNKHGMVLVDHLLQMEFPVNGKHKVVYL